MQTVEYMNDEDVGMVLFVYVDEILDHQQLYKCSITCIPKLLSAQVMWFCIWELEFGLRYKYQISF